MVRYSALEKASSKHPHDWGRAMASAMTKLAEAARIDGRDLEHDFFFGEELQLRIDEDNDGVMVNLTWAAPETGGAPEDSAA
ncbi:hypothetical protein [Arthrobacter cupressi]|uniref:Amphi-Trp domain-containing protein n=1 Tax=Arthrobacter cupressi TaxID=1045773 RepID=A0A1G8K615_9MICC|nr:hypothetical protein [Arthrobacter cupressi]NYD77323.1 hypothetical protein [Arthrobacter cupressi]SDI38878.1 hypothetical protein SAMN05216555_102144 [Arthrobacter cupressi]